MSTQPFKKVDQYFLPLRRLVKYSHPFRRLVDRSIFLGGQSNLSRFLRG